MKNLLLFFTLLLVFTISSYSQQYKDMIDSGTYTVFEIQEVAEIYFNTAGTGKGSGYKQYKRWEYNALHSMDELGNIPTNEAQLREFFKNKIEQNRMVDSSNWEELGPTTWNSTSGWNPGVGRITSFSVDPDDQNHIIVGSPSGGVWRTINGGTTWTVLTDNFINIDVYSLAIHPTNKSTYYWGSTSGIIFVSYDSGANWAQLTNLSGSDVNKILIHPNTPNTMFCTIASGGVFRSTDAGVNWSGVLTGESTGYDIEFKPGDTNTVYATGNRFYKSTNGGASFSEVSTPFTAGQTKMLGVSPADATVVYVVEENSGKFGGFYKSTNSGSSFTKLTHTANYFGYSDTGNDTNGQAPRDMDIVVSPTDINEVHIAGIHTWRSLNGGTSFTLSSYWSEGGANSRNVGYCHADVDIMQFVGSNLYVGSDGGLYINTDSDATISTSFYTDLTAGLGIRQFYKIGVSQTDPEIIVGGSQDNGSSFYNTSGQWFDWLGADGMENFIDKNNNNIFYGTSQGGSLYKSTNGGQSYSGLATPDGKSGNWVTPFEQDPITQNVIYSGYDQVYKSTNGGSSWTAISQDFGPNMDYLKIAPSDNQVMYGSVDGNLYKTIDGGTTNWSTLTGYGGSFITDIAIHPTDPDRVAIATNSSDKVYVSDDGGTTWTAKRLNLPNYSVYALVWEDIADNRLFVGMNYGIYYIDDTISQWQLFANNLPNVRVYEMEINTANGMLYAGTYGRGVFRSLLPCAASFDTALETICETQGIQTGLSGGAPTGGVYSGSGVTDNGDGTFDFDPTVGGPGNTIVTYTVLVGCSGSVVNVDDTIIVTDGTPLLTCQNTTVTLDGGGNASVIWQDVVSNIIPGGYTLGGIAYAPATMTGAATSVSLGDDAGSSAISLGFDFEFYDITYTDFYIASNGFVSFTGDGMTGAASYQPTTIPNAAAPNGMIATVWDDLSPNVSGTITYETFGSSPNSKVVVEFNTVPLYNTSETVTFQVHMYEGTNVIEVHFVDVQNNGGNRTFGIENETGTDALTDPLKNLGNWTASTEAFSFTPVPDGFADNCGNSVSLSLNQSDFTCLDIGANIITVTADDGNGGVATCNATVTVVGPTTTWSGTWDNSVPNAGTKAIFDSNYNTSTGDIDACSCEVESSGTVTIEAGDYIKVEGDIKVDGTLIIEHEGSLVQVDDAALVTNNGTIEVKKTTLVLPANMFSILGSPMTAETRDVVFTNSNVVMKHTTSNFSPNPDVTDQDPGADNFADDNGDNWSFYTGSESISPGVGYLVGPPTGGGAIDVTHTQGTLNNGIINYTAVYNTGGTPTENQIASPNIMSNPYASAIDAYEFVDNNAIVDAIYYWEHITAPTASYPGYRSENWDMGDISIYNLSGGVEAPNEGTDPKPSNQYVASGQGFGIKANAVGTVTFNNAMRIIDNNDTYRNNEFIDRLYLKVENSTYHIQSGTLIAFTAQATDAIDSQFDAKRLATPVSIYSIIDDKELAIQGRSIFNEDHIIPIGFRTMVEESQIYTMSISEIEGEQITQATVYLKDNLLNATTNLTEGSYTFTSNESNQKDRFVLVFTEGILGNIDLSTEAISIYPNPTNSIINIVSPLAAITSVEVYDVRGRKMIAKAIDQQGNYQLDISNLGTAMYFVRISTQAGSVTKRIIKN